jgi:hypothetical protein
VIPLPERPREGETGRTAQSRFPRRGEDYWMEERSGPRSSCGRVRQGSAVDEVDQIVSRGSHVDGRVVGADHARNRSDCGAGQFDIGKRSGTARRRSIGGQNAARAVVGDKGYRRIRSRQDPGDRRRDPVDCGCSHLAQKGGRERVGKGEAADRRAGAEWEVVRSRAPGSRLRPGCAGRRWWRRCGR